MARLPRLTLYDRMVQHFMRMQQRAVRGYDKCVDEMSVRNRHSLPVRAKRLSWSRACQTVAGECLRRLAIPGTIGPNVSQQAALELYVYILYRAVHAAQYNHYTINSPNPRFDAFDRIEEGAVWSKMAEYFKNRFEIVAKEID